MAKRGKYNDYFTQKKQLNYLPFSASKERLWAAQMAYQMVVA